MGGSITVTAANSIRIGVRTERDIPEILSLIRGLAEYEHIHPSVTEKISATRFLARPAAEVCCLQ